MVVGTPNARVHSLCSLIRSLAAGIVGMLMCRVISPQDRTHFGMCRSLLGLLSGCDVARAASEE